MNCKRSILAGMLIGIGGTVYLSVASKELGAALFSLGLLAVMVMECSLYTGKVGYAKKASDAGTLALMCLRNFIGSAVIGIAAGMFLKEKAAAVAVAKLELPLGIVFVKAILCGMMIYIAIELFTRTKEIWLAILPVMIFILCGFEHCVADVFYFAAAGILNVKILLFLVVCIIGNAAGSLIIRFMQQYE